MTNQKQNSRSVRLEYGNSILDIHEIPTPHWQISGGAIRDGREGLPLRCVELLFQMEQLPQPGYDAHLQIHKRGEGKMLFVVGGKIQEVHYEPVISDDQWTTISELLGLPDEARVQLDDYIGYCRELRQDAKEQCGEVWQDALSKVRNAEDKCKKTLENVISNSKGSRKISQTDFFDALAMGLDGQEKIPPRELQVIKDWLKHIAEEKERLVDWYDKALARFHYYERTGKKTGRTSLVTLVRFLNDLLLSRTGERISTGKGSGRGRNYFEYVFQACLIAFPDIALKSKGAQISRIKKAIEKVLKEYLATERTDEIDLWEHLMPGWKEANSLSIYDSKRGIRIEYRGEDGSFEWSVKSTDQTPRSAIKLPDVPYIPK